MMTSGKAFASSFSPKMPLISAIAIAACFSTPAFSNELLTNGDFETGNLSGWTVIDQAGGSGSWYATVNGAGSPLNNFSSPLLATGGNYNAQTDQGGPGSHQLTQSFNGVAGERYILSFDAYAQDFSGQAPVGSGLDFNNYPNQHLEFNLLDGSNTAIFTVPGTLNSAWAHYSFDISALITADDVYTLSFGEVDNQSFYNFGLDNVSLSSGAVPEPATWAMMIGGFGLVGAAARRRKTKTAVTYA